MNKASLVTAACLVLLGCVACADAHYNMLLPRAESVRRGQEMELAYQWGHPFEHQLFDAPQPRKLMVLTPGGKKADILSLAQKQSGAEPVTYRVRLPAEERGDYLFGLVSAPIWMEEEQEFLEDCVKVVVHVQAQRGWDARLGLDFEFVPLTRPYGLSPGCVFQARALLAGKPLPDALVEIEHYNPQPPAALPGDEQITRAVKTDPNGVATCTLTEPGWWSVTAQHAEGTREHSGKAFPVRKRTTFWVFVGGPSISNAGP
jgi:cobalt/nickel transport protein